MVSQLAAVRAAVAVLELGPECGVLVAACEAMAEQLDLHPERASLWREYRPLILDLLGAGKVEDSDGEATILELMRSAVGHSEAV